MHQNTKDILELIKAGKLETTEGVSLLQEKPYDDIGCAKLDTHREKRTGFPEVIFCKGKSEEQIQKIAEHFSKVSGFVMATKADEKAYIAVKAVCPEAIFHKEAQIIISGVRKYEKPGNRILIASAGTADIPIAEEAAVTAETMGSEVKRLYDAGVAGVHRLIHNKEMLNEADVIVVVAGMEGALASVVGGMTDSPVIAVPTSVGYGASFQGLSALLTMLNSCAPGVVVVNIDNGFGAGYFASTLKLTPRLRNKFRQKKSGSPGEESRQL
ncbi:MAG: nickel pincer cofactor biosynthesis protein LarB [Fibrobacteria bacterium]|nr:nickel pincer cofactor biosynthesis protein LarB [Fibrobacteria bacterium]